MLLKSFQPSRYSLKWAVVFALIVGINELDVIFIGYVVDGDNVVVGINVLNVIFVVVYVVVGDDVVVVDDVVAGPFVSLFFFLLFFACL